jgi:hypothetical protein
MVKEHYLVKHIPRMLFTDVMGLQHQPKNTLRVGGRYSVITKYNDFTDYRLQQLQTLAVTSI